MKQSTTAQFDESPVITDSPYVVEEPPITITPSQADTIMKPGYTFIIVEEQSQAQAELSF